MTQHAHTPGPWLANDLSQRVHTAGDVTIAWCGPHSTHVAIANARLIAAAPAMLAELQTVVRIVEMCERNGTIVPVPLTGIRAAIALATGSEG